MTLINIILIFSFIMYLLGFIFKPSNLVACGLAGFSGKRNYNSEKIKFLMYWNSIERGKDATGVFTPKSGIIKDNVKAETFIVDSNNNKKILPDKLLISHVRAKTIGTNIVANAHPFESGDIVLAHNGTLENHLSLAKDYGFNSTMYPVDSQILTKCVSLNIEEGTKIKVLEQYLGAAALLFYNKKTESLYCYHDDKRPLFYGYINNTEMYISSIEESLQAIGCENITEFEVCHLYEIKEGNIISKTKYNKLVSIPKSTIAKGSDIIVKFNPKKQTYKYSSKVENITGITYSDIKADHTKGFWLYCETAPASNSVAPLVKKADLVKTYNWYLSLGRPEGNDFSVNTMYIHLKNEEGEDGIITSMFRFDNNNFIMRKGGYGVLMNRLVYVGSKNVLGEKGDIVFIKDFTYGENEVTIVNTKNNKEGHCSTTHVRVALQKELTEYFTNVNNSCEINFDKKKEDKTKEKETFDDIKNLSFDKEENKNAFDYNRKYSYDTVVNIINHLQAHSSFISELLNSKSININELKKAVDSLDFDLQQLYYPENLYEMIDDDELKNEMKKIDDDSNKKDSSKNEELLDETKFITT